LRRCYEASATWFDFWDIRACEAHAERCGGFTGRLDAGDVLRRVALDRIATPAPQPGMDQSGDQPLQFRTTVVHVRRGAFDVYVGRANARHRLLASKWANPFKIGRDGDRATVLAKYRDYLLGQPDLLADLHELRRKRLGCWCKPVDGFGGRVLCHAQILAGLADGRPAEEVP
jgi:hypothetical protein